MQLLLSKELFSWKWNSWKVIVCLGLKIKTKTEAVGRICGICMLWCCSRLFCVCVCVILRPLRPSPLDAVSLSAFHRLATTSSLPPNNAASSFHRSMSQPSGGVDVSALPSNLLCGLAATTVAAGTAANLPTSAIPSSVSALWRSTSSSPSAASGCSYHFVS